MVAVTSASSFVAGASRYQSRSSMYIRGLIQRNSTEAAEIVPIGLVCAFLGHIHYMYLSTASDKHPSKSFGS